MDAEHQQRRQRLEEASLPLMLDALWAGNVLDIETTLRHVCKKVRLLPVIGHLVWFLGLRPWGAAPALLRCFSCARCGVGPGTLLPVSTTLRHACIEVIRPR